MNLHRNYKQITYSDGTIETFNPIFTYEISTTCGIYEIGFGQYKFGILVKNRICTWTRYKTKFFRIFGTTFYFNYGETKPYNPITGEFY